MTAAGPVLASAELGYHELLERTKLRVPSSCTAIDDVLYGGVDSGTISCISGNRDPMKSQVRHVYNAACR
jgi:hypothetical protein